MGMLCAFARGCGRVYLVRLVVSVMDWLFGEAERY